MSKKRRMTKKKKFKLMLVIEMIVLVLVVVGAIGATIVKSTLDKIDTDEDFNEENLDISDINSEKIDEYINIAVFGVDSRKNYLEEGLSDMIMVASIHKKTKEVKVVSVYRDSYLLQGRGEGKDERFDKATHAYRYGAENSINMLNQCFDLNIKDYVTVNFEAVYMAVDAVGGVDIDISKKEQGDINRYIEELNRVNKTDSPYIYDTGVLHLDGIQATAYGRLREIDTDYKRTERQREVLMQLVKKVQNSSAGQLKKLVEKLAPKVLTSLSKKEILDLALDAPNYEIADQAGFPFEHDKDSGKIKGVWYLVPDNLEMSTKQLHSYLFDDDEYEPSARVKAISEALDDEVGREANTETTYFTSSTEEDSEDSTSSTKAGAKKADKDKED